MSSKINQHTVILSIVRVWPRSLMTKSPSDSIWFPFLYQKTWGDGIPSTMQLNDVSLPITTSITLGEVVMVGTTVKGVRIVFYIFWILYKWYNIWILYVLYFWNIIYSIYSEIYWTYKLRTKSDLKLNWELNVQLKKDWRLSYYHIFQVRNAYLLFQQYSLHGMCSIQCQKLRLILDIKDKKHWNYALMYGGNEIVSSKFVLL